MGAVFKLPATKTHYTCMSHPHAPHYGSNLPAQLPWPPCHPWPKHASCWNAASAAGGRRPTDRGHCGPCDAVAHVQGMVHGSDLKRGWWWSFPPCSTVRRMMGSINALLFGPPRRRSPRRQRKPEAELHSPRPHGHRQRREGQGQAQGEGQGQGRASTALRRL